MLSQIVDFIKKIFAAIDKFLEMLGIDAMWDSIFGDLTKTN